MRREGERELLQLADGRTRMPPEPPRDPEPHIKQRPLEMVRRLREKKRTVVAIRRAHLGKMRYRETQLLNELSRTGASA